ncbi:MAG: hypothetical protein WBD31_06420 [Rubripirellula sp.]
MVEKHFVTFVSPGTFVPETTTKDIESWDVDKAVEMAKEVNERYNATPYSFHFTTRSNNGELDSKETARSCNYFLGGEVQTREQIEARNDPEESILRSNLRSNGIERVVVNTNSWKVTLPLNEDDVVLEFVC